MAADGEYSMAIDSPRARPPPDQWEQWLATTRKTIDIVWEPGKPDKAGPPRLIHLRCNLTRQPIGLA